MSENWIIGEFFLYFQIKMLKFMSGKCWVLYIALATAVIVFYVAVAIQKFD